MEILIEIPPWVVDTWEFVCQKADITYTLFSKYYNSIWNFVTYQRNGLWVILSMIIFWPLWVYFAVAVTTASTWIMWLFASLILGIIQVIYVTYQFIMIVGDVMVLTLLKTYQVLMRSRFIQMVFFFSKRIRKSRMRTSQRRKWKKDCESAKCYADYLKLPIVEPKSVDDDGTLNNNNGSQRSAGGRKGSMKPKRSRSFGTLKTLYEEQQQQQEMASPPSSPQRGMKRNSSFDKKKFNSFPGNGEGGDGDDDIDPSIGNDLGTMTARLLLSTTSRLREARHLFANNDDNSSLEYLLSGVVKRNHLTMEDLLVKNARTVANSGQYEFSNPSRKAIATYFDEVTKSIECLAVESSGTGSSSSLVSDPITELTDRMTLVRKMKQNMGRTALMLSGGGAQAMYHLGTIRALVDSNLYDDISVISGTSGGAITAACCAMHTSDELYNDICIPTVSTDYRLDGRMKKENIRWFPPVMDMGAYWLKHRMLVDSKYFYRTCEFYYGTTTFQEAFERTGKHVCITVSASRATGGTAQRLLLNHISTPHVTLASAVAASCALPGVMKPAKLQTKNSFGEIEPFEVDGVEWIDGSVQADLPFQRISTLFNVSNYIVCQTNFHVLPFLNKDHHPNTSSIYWRLFQTIEWDIRNRALKLSRLGLFPRIFGQDISKVFKQKYHGNLTLVPRFTAAQTFGLQALVNPSVKDMEGYLKYGQLAAWPYLGVIRDMLRLEKALDDCLDQLKIQFQTFHPEVDIDMSETDELDSIASGSLQASGGSGYHTSSLRNRLVRFSGSSNNSNSFNAAEMERLRQKINKLEGENTSLRQQVHDMKLLLGEEEEEDEPNSNNKDGRGGGKSKVELSEAGVWNLVRQLNFDGKSAKIL